MLELIDVTKDTPHGRHIRSVSMRMANGSLNVLLGPTLSGKTSLMRLMAGLDKPTSGDIRVDGKSVIGMPRAEARRGDGLSAVHQLSLADRLREHRLAPARRRASVRRDRDPSAGGRAPAQARRPISPARRFISPAASSSAPPSLALSSSARPWCCSMSRSPILTTSCVRSCVPNCRACSPKPARSWSTPRPSPAKRCCSAAIPPRCTKGR